MAWEGSTSEPRDIPLPKTTKATRPHKQTQNRRSDVWGAGGVGMFTLNDATHYHNL